MTVIPLRGAGWRWSPTWRFSFSETGEAVKVWTGREVLTDEQGHHLRRGASGEIVADGPGAPILREAASPDRDPPADPDGGVA